MSREYIVETLAQLCRRPASGSPIVAGLWDQDPSIVSLSIPKIRHRILAAGDPQWRDDKMITVIEGFKPSHVSEHLEIMAQLRFRNQIILMLSKQYVYGPFFLNRVIHVLDHIDIPPDNR
jgi:hypothetical protein